MENSKNMKTTVEGVVIELTKEQVVLIQETKAKRDAECKSFVSVLKHFGFTKLSTKGWEQTDRICYENKQHDWFAEIFKLGAYHSQFFDCWMAGPGLRNVGFPGGYMYGSPEEVKDALLQALNEIT